MPFCHTEAIGGPFTDRGATTATLVFLSPQRAVNSFGEVVVSFASHVTVTGDLQPMTGKFPRYLHGDVEQVNAMFIVLGNPDLEAGFRTVVSAQQMEIVDVDRFGRQQAEVSLKWVR